MQLTNATFDLIMHRAAHDADDAKVTDIRVANRASVADHERRSRFSLLPRVIEAELAKERSLDEELLEQPVLQLSTR